MSEDSAPISPATRVAVPVALGIVVLVLWEALVWYLAEIGRASCRERV